MSNLSQGVKEKGREEGIAIGEARGRAEGEARGRAAGIAEVILNMYKNGYTAEQIAAAINKDLEEVKAIIGGKEPILS